MRKEEDQLHTTYIQWFRKVYKNYLCWHASNSATKVQDRIKLNRLGYITGMFDIFIPRPPGSLRKETGFFLELKTKAGFLTRSQKLFYLWARHYDFCFYVANDLIEAMEVTQKFLGKQDEITIEGKHKRHIEIFEREIEENSLKSEEPPVAGKF